MITPGLGSVTIGDYYTPQPKQWEFHNSLATYPLKKLVVSLSPLVKRVAEPRLDTRRGLIGSRNH